MKYCKLLILITLLLLAGCKEAPANTPPDPLFTASGPRHQAQFQGATPAVMPAGQIVNQGGNSSALEAYLVKKLEQDERDRKIQEALLEQSRSEADRAKTAAAEAEAHKKGWLDRFGLLALVLLSILGTAVVGIFVLWCHNAWMDKNPKKYNKDEFDKLVANPSPTEAQSRMAQAIAIGLASRRVTLGLVIAGGSLAVSLAVWM